MNLNQPIETQARLQIAKPAAEVYEAIVDPARMSNYFISKGSGRMEEGATVTWSFPEFEGSFPVRIGKVVEGQYVSFYWPAQTGKEHLVELILEPAGEGQTVVTARESGAVLDEAGLAWLRGNTEGWANFLACMKAWLEYGIHLRKGAFDFMRGEHPA